MARFLPLFFLLLVAGCSPFDQLTYYYHGVKYSSSNEALAALRRDNDTLLAAIRQRDKPVAGQARIWCRRGTICTT